MATETIGEGTPRAAAAMEGFGVPVMMLPNHRFFVDRREVDEVVAYSKPEGWLVRNLQNANGHAYCDQMTGQVARERLFGVIDVIPDSE